MVDITTANKSALSFAINAIPRVKEICKPLQNYLGINNFGYLRIYNDCSYMSLINGLQDYQQKYFTYIKSQDPHFNLNLRTSPYNQAKCFIWPTNHKKLYPVISLLTEHDVWHGFSITFRYQEYCEVFYFAFTKNADAKSQFYVQNSKLLEKFCDYFRVQAADLIDDNDKSKLAIYKNKFDISYIEEVDSNRKLFLKEINSVKNHSLINKNGHLVYLTPRESDCISVLMQNRTTKEIGKFLDLSPRTVERHIENIKQKLEVHYKSQLVDIFSNM